MNDIHCEDEESSELLLLFLVYFPFNRCRDFVFFRIVNDTGELDLVAVFSTALWPYVLTSVGILSFRPALG